ncbi:MAG: bluB 1 [Mycobacterium sp.]|nr:bluB 1 [Mycobacterium sp.]
MPAVTETTATVSAPVKDAPWSDWSEAKIFDAIFSPRATRIYKDKPIPEETLTKILRAGTFACSSGNTQPWEFVVVTDADLKAKLQTMLAREFAKADQERAQTPEQLKDGAGRPITGHAAVENVNRVSAIVMVFWNPDRGIRFQDEYEQNEDGTLRPVRYIPGGRGSSLFQACQNIILAAQALGVQSLFTTFFGLVEPEVKELLNVPPRMFLESAVFLGYADEDLKLPRRKPLVEVAHLNNWDNPWKGSLEVNI